HREAKGNAVEGPRTRVHRCEHVEEFSHRPLIASPANAISEPQVSANIPSGVSHREAKGNAVKEPALSEAEGTTYT
ncbi:MAG: hypothetical protein WA555_10705, partial [Candidatus Sulfotelmatobacter sp.]